MVHKPHQNRTSLFMLLFGFAFFGAGAAFMWFMGLKPIWLVSVSADWPTADCTVIESRVKTNSSSDGTTYKPIVRMRYDFAGVTYEGGSYDFNEASSSGYKKKARIVSKYPVGKVARCYINPAKPQQAVLSRKLPNIVWFVIPFCSVFVLVGGVIMAGAMGMLPKRWAKSRHTRVASDSVGLLELKPQTSPRGKVLGFAFFALFWNGIVGVFVFQAWLGYSKGKPEWFLMVFLIPFVLVGFGVIGGFVHAVLSTFNPKPVLRLSEGSPRLGDTLDLHWEFIGNQSRVASVTLTLEACEQATYKVGTSTRTDQHVFFRKQLLQAVNPSEILRRSVRITLPADSMHSFKSSNNAVVWQIRLHGEIHKWADIKLEYPITVRPK